MGNREAPETRRRRKPHTKRWRRRRAQLRRVVEAIRVTTSWEIHPSIHRFSSLAPFKEDGITRHTHTQKKEEELGGKKRERKTNNALEEEEEAKPSVFVSLRTQMWNSSRNNHLPTLPKCVRGTDGGEEEEVLVN